VRTFIYGRHSFGENGTEPELLRKSVEDRGDTVIAAFSDDPAILGKGKNAGWRAVLSDLAQIDQIIINSAGDLPGKSVADLLKILAVLNDHDVSLISSQDGIDTSSGSASVLRLIAAYRFAKRSEAIRAGQAAARAAGKRLGRPAVPDWVRRHIVDDLAKSLSLRAVAHKHNVSPATVINIRRTMTVEPEKLAA
jgi:DNA invertase Pin-like site-specific DNA recombinase